MGKRWANPDWSGARVFTAKTPLQCFGLGCPSPGIAPGDVYTKHRVKASSLYKDREFCSVCKPIRQVDVPAGESSLFFYLHALWYKFHEQDERDALDEYEKQGKYL